MGRYVSLYETTAAFNAVEATLDKPHVALALDNRTVHYMEYVPPVFNNIITYEADAKLTEVSDDPEYEQMGFHTDAFNTTMTSHTFENGVGTIVFDEDVTEIGAAAFLGCSGMTSVTIPDGVTSIGNYAFEYCSGLTSITIPNTVTSIGDNAFTFCSSLTSITIPNSVTSIGQNAFESCDNLQSITIPSSVTYIGEGAFTKCTLLETITVLPLTPPSISKLGNYTESLAHIYVPSESYNAYMDDVDWGGQYGQLIAPIS